MSADLWFVYGDGEDALLFRSKAAMQEYVLEYPEWWTRVVWCNPEEGLSQDITSDVAEAVEYETERAASEARGWDRHVASFSRASGY